MDPEQLKEQPKENFFTEIIRFTIIALLIVLPIRFFIAQPFIVSGASMDPTFENGEYLIVDQVSYRFNSPHRGDVVIFKYPRDESKYFIKRIIGLPSETIEIRGTSVTIKNKENPDGIALKEPYIDFENKKEDTMSVTLRSDQYFVMGDNREQSSDSRAWGSLSRNLIVGRPFVRLFPFTRISIFPGYYRESVK